jgi:anaerobic magnesium-protoporphyrin IX monomethyl ester cyclase
MNICLINPPYKSNNEDPFLYSTEDANNYPQLGLQYIKANLLKHGIEIDIIDCPIERLSIKDAFESIKSNNYKAIGISLFSYNYFSAFKLINIIKEYDNSIFIFIGGVGATLNYKDILYRERNIDCCIIGEGEVRVLWLIDSLINGVPWTTLDGLAFYDHKSNCVIENKACSSFELDDIPNPIRRMVNSENGVYSILTSRGCYANCSFCNEKKFSSINNTSKKRYRDPINVLNELKSLVNDHNPRIINIVDSNFLDCTGTRQEWLKKFIDIMKDEKMDIKFMGYGRANDILVNKNLIQDLIDVGFFRVFVGVESFIDRQLKLYNKGYSSQTSIDALTLLSKYDLEVQIGFIPIDPFVSLEEIKENLNHLISLTKFIKLSHNQLLISTCGVLSVDVGTAIYDKVKAYSLIEANQVGYRFVNDNVSSYVNKVLEWNSFISNVSKKKYLIDKFEQLGLSEEANYLKQLQRKLFFIDLEVMKKLIEIHDRPREISQYLDQKRIETETISRCYEKYLH